MNLVRQPKVLELLGRPGKIEGLTLIAPMSLDLTDATGSGADIVRVGVRKVEEPA